ncbi:MAG: hydantoinase B/oxoprolinase family protein [Deltaproteobacteria bacterium]|nr:MAG: hydantoinase B/oxoprolinase family protein [Deltaproteobacteria bacterium]
MTSSSQALEAVTLSIFGHLFAAIAEEMGGRLMRSAFSPNIKERRDFSCALFDAHGEMIAQAAHIPVHLGSTPMSVQAVLEHVGLENIQRGDVFVVNDPFAGGTHLPDITLVAPCFVEEEQSPRFFVANRAHHADVGGISPGSMPLSTHIDEEGMRISPTALTDEVVTWICEQSRTPEERLGDLQAQQAAIAVGQKRLQELCLRYGGAEVTAQAEALQGYTERVIRSIVSDIPDGSYSFEDAMDDDGQGHQVIKLRCVLEVEGDTATVDWRGSAAQVEGSINAVRSIVVSAVNYAFRCLAPANLPSNGGVMRPIEVLTQPGTVVDAAYPAAVSAGNVETSQRLVDVMLGALAQAIPSKVPAASCGSMNNITIGGVDPRSGKPFAYYETLAGGTGAGPGFNGGSALHSHMTNTLNTPVEALEHAYPFRIDEYRIRRGSGGDGLQRGGDGLVRTYAFDSPAEVTLITERRLSPPYGLQGGKPGAVGENTQKVGEDVEVLPPKVTLKVESGSQISVATPGGGGWGEQKGG